MSEQINRNAQAIIGTRLIVTMTVYETSGLQVALEHDDVVCGDDVVVVVVGGVCDVDAMILAKMKVKLITENVNGIMMMNMIMLNSTVLVPSAGDCIGIDETGNKFVASVDDVVMFTGHEESSDGFTIVFGNS
jgi:hypothetical protein